jgi:transposase
VKKNLATAERRREAVMVLRGQEREEAEWLLKHLELYVQRIQELKAKIQHEVKTYEDMQRLQTVAGVGPVVAYAYVAHVGNGERFSWSSRVRNYLGLIPRLGYSGRIQRQGHITKRGNGSVRSLL